MRKKYDDIKALFEENDRDVIIDTARKQEALQSVCTKNASMKNTAGSRWQLVKGQLLYMNKNILCFHLAACMGMVLLVWTNWCDIQAWEQYSMICSGVLGALSVLEVGSMFFFRYDRAGGKLLL